MATILICGHRSYAARGLKKELESSGHKVFEFSRGEISRDGNVITGPVMAIDQNELIDEDIDIVINFILLSRSSAEENKSYIDAMIRFCKKKRIKRMIQISSFSSYPNDAEYINETTPIEVNLDNKGGYGIAKSAADQRLEELKKHVNFEIIFARPGYIVADDNPHPFKGVAKFFGKNFAILIGNRKSTLPCINRSTLHKCLAEISIKKDCLPVYLLVEGENTTKYSYFKTLSKAKIISLHRWPFAVFTDLAKTFHLMSNKTAAGMKGVFKVQKIDNKVSKNNLQYLK